jgi:hypothetical protein
MEWNEERGPRASFAIPGLHLQSAIGNLKSTI